MASGSQLRPELRAQFIRGYLELDMLTEAAREVRQFTANDCERQEVLEACMEVAARRRTWGRAIDLGERLARNFPESEGGWIGWAYALREQQRIEEARAVLIEAEPRHGKKSAVLHFNLACYHALLGRTEEARGYLRRACKIEPKFKEEARSDPDLASLWKGA